jgi:putative restriction endonuclease
MNRDTQIRLSAFEFLDRQIQVSGEVLPRIVLDQGFQFEGERVLLISPQGIFKPRIMDFPLSITTAPPSPRKPRPYDDELGKDGVIRYRYRGTDPRHRDNIGLRTCMEQRIPLIYLFGLVPGRYLPVWPVYIIGDTPSDLTFSMLVDDPSTITAEGWDAQGDIDDPRRRYITVERQQRLHQSGFRERVLRAYRGCCSICRLKHEELLDAAHILSDKHPKGDPVIANGLALCKLHHAAFDQNILGITPDYIIEVRQDILDEADGPMLQHGLKGVQGGKIHVPRGDEFKPDRERLDIRFEKFKKAG